MPRHNNNKQQQTTISMSFKPIIKRNFNTFEIAGAALVVALAVPTTNEELDSMCGKPNSAVELAVRQVVAHDTLADVRYYFAERFENAVTTEFPDHPELKRQLKPTGSKTKNADGSESPVMTYAETEMKYIKRALVVLASLRGVTEVSIASFQPLMDSLLLEPELDDNKKPVLDADGNPVLLIRFDPTSPERGERGPKTIPKVYITAATGIMNDEAKGGESYADRWLAHYQITVDVPEDATDEARKALKITAIARKIQALEDAKRAQRDIAGEYAV